MTGDCGGRGVYKELLPASSAAGWEVAAGGRPGLFRVSLCPLRKKYDGVKKLTDEQQHGVVIFVIFANKIDQQNHRTNQNVVNKICFFVEQKNKEQF